MLSFRGVSKAYSVNKGAVLALADVDLEVNRGELFVILGPSGSGKSTLLHGAAGLLEFDRGEIWIRGILANDLPIRKRQIAMVMQGLGLYPRKTVRQNIEYPLLVAGLRTAEREAQANSLMALLDLAGEADRLPKHLSGGQKQRVAIGRALARNVDVLLLDEPFSDLDAQHRLRLRNELKLIHSRRRLTTILVTHDQEDALAIADRISLMREGRIVETGTPHDLYLDPCSLFAAQFIGRPPMNLMPGVLDGSKFVSSISKAVLPIDGLVISCKRTLTSEVFLGLRPEELEIVLGGKGWVVEMVEPAGHHDIIHIAHGSVGLTCRRDPLHVLVAGMTVGLRALKPALIFDSARGERLRE